MSEKGEDKWIVYSLVVEHNHELASPNSQKFLRSKRKKTRPKKILLICLITLESIQELTTMINLFCLVVLYFGMKLKTLLSGYFVLGKRQCLEFHRI
ncbi:hypothetical protein RDI58_027027 [Solanum bulbocastanum]|uniref:Protein FAR1-RELATED SEQUENCE n=1 Tax=Solanum bulbocastanum TaxID=147425 RepID=A0AAN8T022_SOLBU